ncbi:tyrosine-type recombinase/integrase [Ketogulonicigenium vulgare]|uniref:tyrosine-type recombinase/integrase n=1 Tax=Ketogulonicigenium vulgare TaxID=92945 RepID=UPI002359EBEB|nr:tyrosine-type recombinase/integrase [Ketogulonicigenium vulgare]
MKKIPSPVLRGSTYYLYRRVPRRYEAIERRAFIDLSLHTDSLTAASEKAVKVWSELVAAWEIKLTGRDGEAMARFDMARELAANRGFSYLPAADVAKLPYAEFAKRMDAAIPSKIFNVTDAEAILGIVPPPSMTVSGALDAFWTLAKDRTLGKSEDQLRRWRNPRLKAVNNFIAVIGDKPIDAITADDMLDFRAWWVERIQQEELTPNSANKDLGHLGDVFNTVNKLKRLGLSLPLGDLKLKQADAKTRPPFSTPWIRERILHPDALASLNEEARAIVLVMVNTGCRPSEIAALTANCIHLDHNVPHISIEPEGRQLKTKHARRTIPLLGVSLEAMREFPAGFPRYGKKSASLSATVIKYFRENGLMESEEHVLYSLRHAFEDRMLAAGIDDRIRRDLFGHALTRERYGDGASISHKQELLQAVAL